MPIPTVRLVRVALALLTLSGLLLPYFVVTGRTFPAFYAIGSLNAILLLLFVADWLTLPSKRKFSASRTIDGALQQNAEHKILLTIDNRGKEVTATIHDDLIEFATADVFPATVQLGSGRNTFTYGMRVSRRGLYPMNFLYVSCSGKLGFAKRIMKLPCPGELRVYPDLRSVSKWILLSRTSRLSFMGIRRIRTGGGDTEFERLRDYTRDDEYRKIDWKATAKHRKFLVRSYQQSRNQTIMFMIDCGRMMTAEHNGTTLLDQSLASALLLARVALEQGDRVGILAFSNRVHRFVSPVSGAMKHRNLVQACFDLHPGHEESNFDLAFRHLQISGRKRSLVCLITNVIDEANANMIRSHLEVLSGRHLPLAVLLKMKEIQDLATGSDSVALSAGDFLSWRKSVVHRLSAGGVLVLESFPDQLEAGLINQYLWIKARHLL